MRGGALAAGLALSGAGCAALGDISGGRIPIMAPSPRDIPRVSLRRALDRSLEHKKVRFVAAFEAVEEAVLDLPDDYHRGWERVVVSDLQDASLRTNTIVLPTSRARHLRSFKRGDRIEVLAARIPIEGDDEGFNQGATMVLRAESIREARPESGSGAASRDYVDRKEDGSLLRLHPDGKFELRQRGRTVVGTAVREGDTLNLQLPGGKIGKATFSGESLIDPDGKEWVPVD